MKNIFNQIYCNLKVPSTKLLAVDYSCFVRVGIQNSIDAANWVIIRAIKDVGKTNL